jgi:hypothetical protein
MSDGTKDWRAFAESGMRLSVWLKAGRLHHHPNIEACPTCAARHMKPVGEWKGAQLYVERDGQYVPVE